MIASLPPGEVIFAGNVSLGVVVGCVLSYAMVKLLDWRAARRR